MRTVVIFCLFAILSISGFSQPDPRHNGNGSNVGNTPVGNDPTPGPIDGGLTIFLLLGAAFGARKAYKVKSLE